MKILYVNDFYEYGGAEVIMRELAGIMRTRGHETYLAATSDLMRENYYKIKRIRRRIPFLLRRTIFFNIDPVARRALAKVIDSVKPDIIHCHNLANISLAPIDIAADLDIPCLVTIHDYWPVCLNRGLLKSARVQCIEEGWQNCASESCRYRRYDRIIRPFVGKGMKERRQILSAANVKLVCVSEYVRSVLERFRYGRENVAVIHNGIDVNHFRPDGHGTENIVLFVGRLIPSKGIGDFITVAERVRKRNKGARFLVIGGKLEKRRESVENLGRISDSELLQYYQRSTCICIPSLWTEPFPTVALEAMACGKPVVAYSVGGLPEIVDDGETGFLVQPGDVVTLSERLLRLLENPSLAEEMGRRARVSAEQEFSLNVMGSHYESLYRAVTN